MKNKKFWLLLLILAAVLIGSSILYDKLGSSLAPDQLATQATQPEETGETPTETEDLSQYLAPDFTVYDLEGNQVKLSDYFGKPIVLNFWASWCGPCKMEMPEFEEKYRELGEEVQFLMVNMTTGNNESQEKASGYVRDQGFTFPVLYDLDSSAAVTYSVYSLPTTYFISREGYLMAQAMGAIDGDTLQRGIDMIR